MVARLGRRAFEWIVGVFALLGFVYVPLGKKTGFEHVQAIFTTREAEQAGRDLVDRASDLRRRIFAGTSAARGSGGPPEERGGAGSSGPEKAEKKRSPVSPARSASPTSPRPELPDLALVELEVPDAGVDASLEWSPEPSVN